MIKTIDTLIPDIYETIRGKGGWDKAISEFFSEGLGKIAHERFIEEQLPRDYIGLSQVGNPCKRELWYTVNDPSGAEELSAEALGTFFYGDILELLVISLAKASGHRVDGLQESLEVDGIKGHGDCIIDGMVVDVKSASRFGFEKFRNGKLREDDPFGYISQLSSYLYAYQNDSRVTTKTKAAFLAVQKDRFKLALDVYDFSEELANKPQEIANLKETLAQPSPPERLPDEPEGKSGNKALGVKCSYCSHKFKCWPDVKGYAYSNGPKYLTKVVKEPKVPKFHG